MNDKMPAVFFGHGNPMNAISSNAYTDAWRQIGASIPRPRGIVSISAHWYIPQTAVTAMPQPRTIYDFGGFPPELYKVKYDAPGSPELAGRVAQLLGSDVVLEINDGVSITAPGRYLFMCFPMRIYPSSS